VHEALIRETQQDRLIGHIARDSTAIEARERFPETPAQRAARHAERKAKLKQQRKDARAACRWRRKRVPIWRAKRSQWWGYALACAGRRNGEAATAFFSQAGLSTPLARGVR